jgi:hypothetical protein
MDLVVQHLGAAHAPKAGSQLLRSWSPSASRKSQWAFQPARSDFDQSSVRAGEPCDGSLRIARRFVPPQYARQRTAISSVNTGPIAQYSAAGRG